VLAFVNERVRRRHGIPKVNPLLRGTVRCAFRLVFALQDRAPERKTPFSGDLGAPKFKERRSAARKQERSAKAPAHQSGRAK
jgi:hypothetical protein